MANSVDPDEMARYEPSHLDLRCVQFFIGLQVEIVKRFVRISLSIFFFTVLFNASNVQIFLPSLKYACLAGKKLIFLFYFNFNALIEAKIV